MWWGSTVTISNNISSGVLFHVQIVLLQKSYGVFGGDGLRWDLWEARWLRWGELGVIKRGEAGCVRVPWTQMDLNENTDRVSAY